MASDKIRGWIRKKLEKGVEEERIRESLRNTGHDPDLVDEVKNSDGGEEPDPFDDGEPDGQDSDGDTDDGDGFEFASSEEEEDNSSDSFSVPELPVPGRRSASIVLISVLVAVSMAGVFAYAQGSEVLEPECPGDSGAGVKVYDVYVEGGSTVAEVNTYEDITVVLEVFESGEKIDQTVEEYPSPGTRTSISVGSVGDRISFHQYGCSDPSVDRNY